MCVALGPASRGQEPLELDRYGGLKGLSFGPGKCFRTHYDGQRWWLVTPDGGAFLSLGVCVVNSVGDTLRGTNRQPYRENVLQKHGSVEKWVSVTRDRLKEWGINTLGAWCGDELRRAVPYTLELSVSAGLWGNKTVPDFFSPEAETHIRNCAAGVEATANDPYLLGYYLDNELPWAADWRLGPDLFPAYVALPPQAPGKKKLVEFFKERYQTPDRFASVWKSELKDWTDLENLHRLRARDKARAQEDREAFVRLVARQYFKTATEAIRAKDKDHLILGCRFVWPIVPNPVVQACGEYCDVVSINHYETGPIGKLALVLSLADSLRVPTDLTFQAFHDLTKKPLLITEFGFRARDSGMPNTYPPPLVIQPTVASQKERADKFEQCAATWMSRPYFVGYHWFEYMDEPKGGRFDGENGNYGLVTIDDEPYTEFVERLEAVNRRVWDLHSASGQPK
jgi:hypothetical protein